MPNLRQPASLPTPLHLLELNIISAQDLHPVTRGMQTYAVAWAHPRSKLSTRVDADGGANPTWNDKFVFRIDDDFLRSDTSAFMIEIFCVRFFRDAPVGSVRVLLSSLFPASSLRPPAASSSHHLPTRFVALQVRRPSGRPQGILNIGVALLDGSIRSMPLYSNVSGSAVGYRDLMELDAARPDHHHHRPPTHLRRTKSDLRSELADDLPPFSTIDIGDKSALSAWSDSEIGPSPSVVAAKVAAEELKAAAEELRVVIDARKKLTEAEGDKSEAKKAKLSSTTDDYEVGSSVLEDWSVPSPPKKEDLKGKLERWRAELPPIYDAPPVPLTPPQHGRRKTDGGGGLFSCFGDSYGCECSIFCGLSPKNGGRNGGGAAVPAKMHPVASDPKIGYVYL